MPCKDSNDVADGKKPQYSNSAVLCKYKFVNEYSEVVLNSLAVLTSVRLKESKLRSIYNPEFKDAAAKIWRVQSLLLQHCTFANQTRKMELHSVPQIESYSSMCMIHDDSMVFIVEEPALIERAKPYVNTRYWISEITLEPASYLVGFA